MSISEEAKQYLANLVGHLSSKANFVIDADTHITDTSKLPEDIDKQYKETLNYYHGRPISAEDLIAEMDMSDVDMALSWQNPAATPYGEDLDENFDSLMEANRYIYQVSRKYPERFIPAGWTDPKAVGLDNALKVVDICVHEFGFPVVKMNPAQNSYPITSDDVITIAKRITDYGAVTAFHYGADTPFTPAAGLEAVAQKLPEGKFLGVHMGGGGAGYVRAEKIYLQTREMGLRSPNVHFIMSAKRDTHIESDLIVYQQAGLPYSANISCASDAPYGRISWNFGGYRSMFQTLQNKTLHPDARISSGEVVFDEESIAGYMGNNFARLIRDTCTKMLS